MNLDLLDKYERARLVSLRSQEVLDKNSLTEQLPREAALLPWAPIAIVVAVQNLASVGK